MNRTNLLFETTKTAPGSYECVTVRQQADPATEREQQQHSAEDASRQSFAIDPNIAATVAPEWAQQAQAIFFQSLQSNSAGGHAEYLKQMQLQFESMRQLLQQQLARFSQPR
ncbi:hypothetical protein ACFO3I_14310 [Rheinheimera marina]|uniref:Uncharacterized protein n=1 Tax=Rheinheimera marina TaxID=1774958 RepID=A0ABV9JPR5_9GAMM